MSLDARKAANGTQAPPPAPAAKPARSVYRRRLPHAQPENRTFFVTFVTARRWILPEEVRSAVLRHCLHDHMSKHQMHAAVVMPDHVHVLFSPLRDGNGNTFGLAQIMHGIKGASAHTVNRMLRRTGPVWTRESFDRVVRLNEGIRKTAEYICQNPVRAGLSSSENDYQWLWRAWVEGLEREA